MRKKSVVLVIIVVLLIGVIAGFVIYRQNSTEHTLEWVYEKGGINVIWGDKLFAKDTHGGFHGDGSSLYAFQYTDSSMEPEMEESELWKALPFSDAVSDLINNSIGDECFRSCSKLISITILATNPPAGGKYFDVGVPDTYTIYVPEGSVEKYKTHSFWKSYASHIKAIE